MTALAHTPSAERFGARTIQEGSYVNTTWSPYDGTIYWVVTWVVRQQSGPARFFAIARYGAPLTGDFVPLTQELTFHDYVEQFGVSQDLDLELLWAGWRALLYLCGREDQAPPADLPRWRADWYAELSLLPQATYLVVTSRDRYTVTLHRSGPRAFTATVVDSAGRDRGSAEGYPSRREALDAAQIGVIGEAEALGH
jgi:hypothetical protein